MHGTLAQSARVLEDGSYDTPGIQCLPTAQAVSVPPAHSSTAGRSHKPPPGPLDPLKLALPVDEVVAHAAWRLGRLLAAVATARREALHADGAEVAAERPEHRGVEVPLKEVGELSGALCRHPLLHGRQHFVHLRAQPRSLIARRVGASFNPHGEVHKLDDDDAKHEPDQTSPGSSDDHRPDIAKGSAEEAVQAEVEDAVRPHEAMRPGAQQRAKHGATSAACLQEDRMLLYQALEVLEDGLEGQGVDPQRKSERRLDCTEQVGRLAVKAVPPGPLLFTRRIDEVPIRKKHIVEVQLLHHQLGGGDLAADELQLLTLGILDVLADVLACLLDEGLKPGLLLAHLLCKAPCLAQLYLVHIVGVLLFIRRQHRKAEE
eukprot:CAMPEP_0179169204 /NCGR_PEP_ID=MMETSP0796-20121207/83263_1 /TAXON_ID=73915 /ORGANISM="Pyrodinium bahamense, Strain pbaha01" /LENGTH=374 /DNA_ID=CAMNT_0020872015 /DNA_START=171 /DNA_END=1296 /DNA_ORIENTATION=+